MSKKQKDSVYRVTDPLGFRMPRSFPEPLADVGLKFGDMLPQAAAEADPAWVRRLVIRGSLEDTSAKSSTND